MYCEHCGKPVRDGDAYCQHCSAVLSGVGRSTEAGPRQATTDDGSGASHSRAVGQEESDSRGGTPPGIGRSRTPIVVGTGAALIVLIAFGVWMFAVHHNPQRAERPLMTSSATSTTAAVGPAATAGPTASPSGAPANASGPRPAPGASPTSTVAAQARGGAQETSSSVMKTAPAVDLSQPGNCLVLPEYYCSKGAVHSANGFAELVVPVMPGTTVFAPFTCPTNRSDVNLGSSQGGCAFTPASNATWEYEILSPPGMRFSQFEFAIGGPMLKDEMSGYGAATAKGTRIGVEGAGTYDGGSAWNLTLAYTWSGSPPTSATDFYAKLQRLIATLTSVDVPGTCLVLAQPYCRGGQVEIAHGVAYLFVDVHVGTKVFAPFPCESSQSDQQTGCHTWTPTFIQGGEGIMLTPVGVDWNTFAFSAAAQSLQASFPAGSSVAKGQPAATTKWGGSSWLEGADGGGNWNLMLTFSYSGTGTSISSAGDFYAELTTAIAQHR